MLPEQKRLLQDINVLDFTLTDLREYLDTHPYDHDAITYYNRYVTMLKQAQADYAARYTPLIQDNVGFNDQKWKWALDPMPWEGGL